MPVWKDRFNLSSKVSPKLISSIIEDTRLGLEECEIFSVREELSNILDISDEYQKDKVNLTDSDVRSIRSILIESSTCSLKA